MPLHRIPKGDDPPADLQNAIDRLEKSGQAVVRYDDRGDEWLILTRPPKPRHTPAGRGWETRG